MNSHHAAGIRSLPECVQDSPLPSLWIYLPGFNPALAPDSVSSTLALSPRLHNSDLAPTKTEGRRWGRYSIFALWTNDVHNIANYSFAIGLYALGLNGWEILLSSESARPWCSIS